MAQSKVALVSIEKEMYYLYLCVVLDFILRKYFHILVELFDILKLNLALINS